MHKKLFEDIEEDIRHIEDNTEEETLWMSWVACCSVTAVSSQGCSLACLQGEGVGQA